MINNVMRLVEIVSPPLYLCTAAEQKVGTTITQQAICPLGAAREGKLENRRPEDRLPRDSSFYLHTSPCSNAEHVYAVQPVGQVDKHHTSWLRKLEACDISHRGEVDGAAQGYWSGVEIPEERDAPWEHRTAKVKILKRVGGTVVV